MKNCCLMTFWLLLAFGYKYPDKEISKLNKLRICVLNFILIILYTLKCYFSLTEKNNLFDFLDVLSFPFTIISKNIYNFVCLMIFIYIYKKIENKLNYFIYHNDVHNYVISSLNLENLYVFKQYSVSRMFINYFLGNIIDVINLINRYSELEEIDKFWFLKSFLLILEEFIHLLLLILLIFNFFELHIDNIMIEDGNIIHDIQSNNKILEMTEN